MKVLVVLEIDPDELISDGETSNLENLVSSNLEKLQRDGIYLSNIRDISTLSPNDSDLGEEVRHLMNS